MALTSQGQLQRRSSRRLLVCLTVGLIFLANPNAPVTSEPRPICEATYTVTAQSENRFSAEQLARNHGPARLQWSLRWSFDAGQRVESTWNATVAQSGDDVTATNLDCDSGAVGR